LTIPVHRIPAAVRRKARRIKLLLLDVDGVLTDGGILMGPRGEEIKRFDVRDGQGIKLCLQAGIEVGLVTTRFSPVVRRRARELGIRMVFQKVMDKGEVYRRIKQVSGLADAEIAYMGDDIVDMPVLRRVGLALAVKDSAADLRGKVDYLTRATGGHGAVREVAEVVLQAQGKWQALVRGYSR